VNDANDASTNTYTVTPASVQRGLATVINYDTSVDNVSVKGGSSNTDTLVITGTVGSPVNTYTVTSNYVHHAGVATVTYNSALENLLLNGSPVADIFNLQTTSISATITGDAGEDTFIFANGATLLETSLDGGPGFDKLDYSAYTNGVTVILPSIATGVARIASIRDVTGGSGNDTLIGNNAGDNILTGGPGNDDFNGRGGNDALAGGPGNDIYFFESAWGVDSVIEAASEGLDTMKFTELTIPLTVTISSVSVTDGLSNTATHPGNEVETVITGSGDDTFNVSASALISRSIRLEGRAHAAGDVLNFDAMGLPVTSTTNLITTEGRQPLVHFEIEQINLGVASDTNEFVFLPLVGKGF
jgi:Ca2+-binding RTX toxin-like protein